MPTASPALAAVIRTAAEAAGVPQRAVVKATGTPAATLSRKWHGHKSFDYDELVVIAQLLGTTVPDLHTEAERAA